MSKHLDFKSPQDRSYRIFVYFFFILTLLTFINEVNGKKNKTKFHKFPTFPPSDPEVVNCIGDTSILTKFQLQFAEDGVKSHNKFRDLHDVPMLSLDPQLALDSFEWAQKVAEESDLSGELVLKHSKLDDRGENIYACKGPDHWIRWTGTNATHSRANEAVAAWYSEINNYNYSNPRYHYLSGHFTQLIWKESKTMGMAWAIGARGTIAVVAQYRPFGNVVNVPGEFERNVLPLSPKKAPKKKLKLNNAFKSVLKQSGNDTNSTSSRVRFIEEFQFD